MRITPESPPEPPQNHPRTTPEPPRTTPEPPQNHHRTTPEPPQNHPRTTPEPPQNHPRTTTSVIIARDYYWLLTIRTSSYQYESPISDIGTGNESDINDLG